VRFRKTTARVPRSLEAFGVPVRLVLDRELEPRILEILPPGWRPSRSDKSGVEFELRRTATGSYQVLVGGNTYVGQSPLDLAIGVLDAQLRLHIAARAPDWIFVHAGVVASEDRAIVIPGQSFSGKTTLVKALIDAGATYYSDEYAVLDAEGRVHPYPRRLSLRDAQAQSRGSDPVELGARVADQAASVALVAVTRYRPGHTWEPRRLSAGQGVPTVLANTVPAHDRPRESLRAVTRALSGAVVLEGDRGDAAEVAGALLEELAATAAPGGAGD
jgi:hypothetical protein